MPTVILQGGLGNQLFQYAVGRSLSLKTGTKLYLETSTFARSSNSNLPPRTLHLPKFAIQGEIIQKPIENAPLLKGRFKLFSLLSRVNPELAARICRVHKDLQDSRRFTPYVLNIPGNAFLYGYYQSEKYFHSSRKMIRKELFLQNKPSGINQKWKSQIERKKSVGVHVRRGDYTRQGWTLPVEYYQSAIKRLKYTTKSLNIFFFSDNIEWVKENTRRILPGTFSLEKTNYIDFNSIHDPHKDLWLMSSCTHNIISNSTFSWWGAWLNYNEEKRVIAPAYWIRDRADRLDIIPNRWEVVDW
jgi:hypothetical protein